MASEVHIRSIATGRYLSADREWSTRHVGARNFQSAAEARDWCIQERLANVEIVFVRDALVCMRVPVTEDA
jgi:hypothetical protein